MTTKQEKDEKIRAQAERRGLFILRHAALYGSVKAKDVREAFGVGHSSAATDLRSAAENWPLFFDDLGRAGLKTKIFAVTPPEARGSELLKLIGQSARPEDVGFVGNIPIKTSLSPGYVFTGNSDDGVVEVIMQAILDERGIDISYVGMKKEEVRKARAIYPVGLELAGRQWRVIAHDIEDKTLKISSVGKTFALARIFEARANARYAAKSLRAKNDLRSLLRWGLDARCKVTLNPHMTADQIEAVTREFGLKREGASYVVSLPARGIEEFRRDYCATDMNALKDSALSDYVYPFFLSIELL
ncbi:WYL domain-containing protein [Pseudaeromonas sp. ZJS20]|uniref:WYL domain-containing protein n=1 Tax=Pseudaeromonas aegiceratis TaxID=3153928 RepID=UPI00390C50F6